jgi:hypothetical protein
MQGWDGSPAAVCEKVQIECEGGVEVSSKAVSVDVDLGLPSRLTLMISLRRDDKRLELRKSFMCSRCNTQGKILTFTVGEPEADATAHLRNQWHIKPVQDRLGRISFCTC